MSEIGHIDLNLNLLFVLKEFERTHKDELKGMDKYIDIENATFSSNTGTSVSQNASKLKHLRWYVLPFILMTSFGSYYIYDYPATIGTGLERYPTIQSKFQSAGQNYTSTMNANLYTVYSYPNMVVALFGGVLIDRFFGIRKAMLLLGTLITLGSFLFWLGVVYCSYPTILIGRILYSLGAGVQWVARCVFLIRWFNPYFITRRLGGAPAVSFALGMGACIDKLGKSCNFFFMHQLSSQCGIEFAVFTGVIACTLSMISTIVLVILDARVELVGEIVAHEPKSQFECKSIVSFSSSMWLIAFINLTAYMAILPFLAFGVDFLEPTGGKYTYTKGEASNIVSISEFVVAGVSPLFGRLIDRNGRLIHWTAVACVSLCLFHLLFLLESLPPVVMMVWLGVAYSIIPLSLRTGVAHVVPQSRHGTAYGLLYSLQNFGSGTMSLVVGAIFYPGHFSARGADIALILFMVSSGVALALCCCTYVVDKRNEGLLNATPAEREEIEKDPERRPSFKFGSHQNESSRMFYNNSVQSQTTFLYGTTPACSEGPLSSTRRRGSRDDINMWDGGGFGPR